jgi:hypothetical protein
LLIFDKISKRGDGGYIGGIIDTLMAVLFFYELEALEDITCTIERAYPRNLISS